MPRHSRLPNSILRPASWPNTSLMRNGTPRKGPVPSARLVEDLDAVGIGLDDRVDVGVDRVDRPRGGLRQLFRRDLLAGDQVRKAQSVVAGIFGEFHAADPSIRVAASLGAPCADWQVRPRLCQCYGSCLHQADDVAHDGVELEVLGGVDGSDAERLQFSRRRVE